jgi:ABC-type nitrate/sulfonate/bicarbonate transport system substrate-binding protein
MTISRRELLRTAAGGTGLLVAAPLLAACGSDKGPTQLASMSVMFPTAVTLNFAPALLEDANGGFRDAGIAATLQYGRNSPQALQQVVAGNSTLARVDPLLVAQAVLEQQAAIVSIAADYQRSVFTVASPEDRAVRSIAELRGKRVGLPSLGGGAESTLDAQLTFAGVPAASVSRIAVGTAAAAWAFVEQGKADAVLLGTDALVTLRQRGTPLEAFNLSGVNPIFGAVWVVHRDTLTKRRDDLVRFMRALAKGFDAFVDDRKLDQAVDAIKNVDIPLLKDRALAKATMREIADAWLAAGRDNLLRHVPDLWSRELARLVDAGIIKPTNGPADATRIYTNAILDAATG